MLENSVMASMGICCQASHPFKLQDLPIVSTVISSEYQTLVHCFVHLQGYELNNLVPMACDQSTSNFLPELYKIFRHSAQSLL